MKAVRKNFPITKHKIYLNHAATGPPARQTLDAVDEMLRVWSTQGNHWEISIRRVKEAKKLFAKLIHAKEEEVALIPNTSTGVSIIASALKDKGKDEVILNDLEFPANYYPWVCGYKVKVVRNKNGKVKIKDYENEISHRTICLPVSHVEYGNGFKHDLTRLAKLAHARDAYLFVDAIQSLGAIEINVKKYSIDALATGCQKWLLSPPGTGFLYIKEELIQQFEPTFVGWLSVKEPENYEIRRFKLSNTASRFETGTPNLFGYAGVAESLRMLSSIGIKNISQRILKLTDHLIERIKEAGMSFLTPLDKEHRSGIVNFRVPHAKELVEKLREKNIVVSSRYGGVRVSPHFYNTIEELDELVDLICKLKT